MNNRGFTLLEATMALSISTIVAAALFAMSISIADTTRVEEVRASNLDESRRFLQRVTPLLRQASGQSINWQALPGDVLSFQCAEDLDGNGTAVDAGGDIELGTIRTIRRDTNDENNDGLTDDQLVMIQDDVVTVLANRVSLDNESPGNDTNGNGRIDRGFWVENLNGRLQVFIQTQGETRQGHEIKLTLSERIAPRN